ncbi:ATP-dependent DNA helicase (plasmid) [Paenibacillus urinalis]|uniref:DNA 5'-3' helicase n=1 Tax=Paenibacillus urinalis TaxID=521520 RepID=A0AAX3N600_9BACL|nr:MULTISPECIES: ATP-dependent DNA helicase [Paenibacillus]MCM3130578.1 ATP-dependent DNA helicase [Paenibacillus sp. MER 78]WDH85270.1 ATP-dependent DNA helicase [Paenibacillus urinalis]WDH95096.1 ATP-dependent DNA helicase [Paenibacillus urinalis]WDI05259.1 ATP-dependent DNA helicase [Paenibacillus urinalis]
MEEFIQRALGAGGHLSKLVKGYSPRSPQMLISNKVGAALEGEKHLLAEAGTGTGKSLGYLIPAAKWAVENNKTVIVCTHTIPLMTQIVNVELPRVQQILKMEHQNLKYQLVKGKSHYVCYSKLENLWQETLRSINEEAKTVQKIFKKVTREYVNDRTGLGFDVEDSLWKKISASNCPAINKPESCVIEELKEKMIQSHIIVTNHAYFFSDLAIRRKTGNGSLPNYDAVIFDEAHEMEDVCCQIFEKSADINQFESLFDQLFQRDIFKELDHGAQLKLSQLRQDIHRNLDQVFAEIGNEMGNKAYQLLDKQIDVSEACSLIKDFLETLKSMNVRGASDILDQLFEYNDDLDFISNNAKRSWAYWATVRGRDQITLHAAPLFPKVVLASSLFDKVPVILTSATMSNSGNFSFFAGRVGVKEYDSVVVGSPFDYINKTMIIVPDDAPEPNSPGFNGYTAEKLEEITMYTGGRMLVLFTSFDAMNQVARSFQKYCSEVGYHLLVQYPGCNREELIQQLKNEPRTIVFGSSSFWTGVDVAGEALTTVVIPRLPFPHPDDPLIKAQIELLEKANRSSFFDYMFPKMIFKLKQGFGRLNRSVHCQGAVIILDNRMRTKRYKGLIIKSLPKCQYSSTVSDLVHILPV